MQVHVLQMSPVHVLQMSPVHVLQMSPVHVLQVRSSPGFTTCSSLGVRTTTSVSRLSSCGRPVKKIKNLKMHEQNYFTIRNLKLISFQRQRRQDVWPFRNVSGNVRG